MNYVNTNIKGTDYRLIRLDPVKGGRVAVRVGALLAAAAADLDGVTALVDAYKNRAQVTPADGSPVPSGLEALTSMPKLLAAMAVGIAKIDSDVLYDLALQCVRGNLFADQKLTDDEAINRYFATRQDHLFLVLAWALKENCAGFFGFAGRA